MLVFGELIALGAPIVVNQSRYSTNGVSMTRFFYAATLHHCVLRISEWRSTQKLQNLIRR
jgi:hypothetical protein